jgi:anti-sigma B factor antagonist
VADGGAARVSASTNDAGYLIISLEGELDIANADEVGRNLEPYLSDGAPSVVFDLGKLEFMDSSGIALLVEVANRLEELEVRSATPIVRRVLKVTGLIEAFCMTE